VVVAALGAALLVAGLGSPSSADEAAGSSRATTETTVAAGQKATISVLPPISQPGKGAASITGARTVVAVDIQNGKEGRPVNLERLSGTSWVKAGKAKLNERGLADFSVSTTLGGLPVTYRATSPKFQGKPAVTTSEVLSTQWGTPEFSDEFSGRALGPTWSNRVPGYNPKGLRRCSRGSEKAVKVGGGTVQLSVLADKSKGKKLCTAKRADGKVLGKFKYRLNGHIATNQSFTYGVAAARMKFQKSKGQHSSFWMQPSYGKGKSAETAGAEIDIIEWFGHPSKGGGLTSFIYHPTKKGPKKVGDFIENPDQYLTNKSDAWWKQYHVFSVEWTRSAYIFRIDGQETFRTTQGISGVPQFPILSLLSSDYELDDLGGENKLPQHMDVDWIQFWQADTAS
jgi:beta-glucanase (GH16 family)